MADTKKIETEIQSVEFAVREICKTDYCPENNDPDSCCDNGWAKENCPVRRMLSDLFTVTLDVWDLQKAGL